MDTQTKSLIREGAGAETGRAEHFNLSVSFTKLALNFGHFWAGMLQCCDNLYLKELIKIQLILLILETIQSHKL